MKITLGLFLIVFLLGCQKEKFISEEYQKLIGEWHNTNGDYTPRIVFKKNGSVTYSYAGERGYNFRVKHTEIGTTYQFGGNSWTRLSFESKNTDSALPSIGFDSPQFDTIMFHGIKFTKL